MNLDLPYPDAIVDHQTYANVMHQARLMLVGLLLLQGAFVVLRRLISAASRGTATSLPWMQALFAGGLFGASAELLGNFLDVVVPSSKDVLPGLGALVGLGYLAGVLARSASERPMRQLQVANASLWLGYGLGSTLIRRSLWDDVVLTVPAMVGLFGAGVAVIFVITRWWTGAARSPRDMYDTMPARCLAVAAGAILATGFGLSWGDRLLDDARPWRTYAKPIASFHVVNQSGQPICLSSRSDSSADWSRFDRFRSGGPLLGNGSNTANGYWAGADVWTHRDAPSGSFEVRLILESRGPEAPRLLQLPQVEAREHLRLRIDHAGRAWLARGREGWLGAVEFGEETLAADES